MDSHGAVCTVSLTNYYTTFLCVVQLDDVSGISHAELTVYRGNHKTILAKYSSEQRNIIVSKLLTQHATFENAVASIVLHYKNDSRAASKDGFASQLVHALSSCMVFCFCV